MTKNQPLLGQLVKGAQVLALAMAVSGLSTQLVSAQQPFKLGAEAQTFIESAPAQNNSYPSPSFSSGTAQYSQQQNPLQGGAQQQQQQRPMQLGAQTSVALPPAFMGSWLVKGALSGLDAAPQFKDKVGGLFQQNTSNTWNIAGSPQQGYQMSNDMGVSTALTIYKVSKNTAFIRYQHPMGKTMAQEAIVMELQNGGATFQGLERISIVKEGEPGPRAKITYQLLGQRQR